MRKAAAALVGSFALLAWLLPAQGEQPEGLSTRYEIDREAWKTFIEINRPADPSSSSSPTRWET